MSNKVKLILVFILGVIISVSISVYASSIINSKDVLYDNTATNLSANVQGAIDETYSKANTLSNRITTLENTSILDKVYPVGSIYISVTLSTAADVSKQIGGTWESYGQGKTLIGSGTGTDSNGNTQTFSVSNNTKNLGEYTHKLTVAELAKHTHDITSSNGPLYTDYEAGIYDTPIRAAIFYTVKSFANPYIATESGGDAYHNNVQPYITVYIYKRTK